MNDLVYLRARYYNTLTRRFVNSDPAREGWNWYAYAGGNPLSYVDPTGLGLDSALDKVQTTLSYLGMVPVVGEIFDVVNAGISFIRGDSKDGIFHLAATIPIIGNGVALGKNAYKVGKNAKNIANNATRTVANTTRGWKVGDPINNLTNAGNVPKWDTVRKRYWKNEALSNGLTHSPTNVERMQRGLAPQRINPNTGRLESMELHHTPPQRDGGLFDVQPVWPADHATIDPFRNL